MNSLFSFDQQQRTQGCRLLAGVDEAGRGPIAGPVVAAAVILPAYCDIAYLRDSKQVSPERRQKLYNVICEQAESVGIGIITEDIIDKINILQATFVAMRSAVFNLTKVPDYILVDGCKIPQMKIPQKGIIKGDCQSAAIAAASIIAKVIRDKIMVSLSLQYPDYGFERHKGYGTYLHISRLKIHGPCKIHRFSFSPVKRYLHK